MNTRPIEARIAPKRSFPRSLKHVARVLRVSALCGSLIHAQTDHALAAPPKAHPNILFVIMDDVGIDQLQLFGFGGAVGPSTPTLAQIAEHGVRFTNTWSMPACSTSRATFFTGRYPLRTGVEGALGPADLANAMVAPSELTTPKLLKHGGYTSALFGKFHMGLQANNPYGAEMIRALGWDYFYGWYDETGDPPSIDTTAGGVAPRGTWSCGFVPGERQGGADSGACYSADGSCQPLTQVGFLPPGRVCRDRGGIFDPHQTCQSPRPDYLSFDTFNGHYVSPLLIQDATSITEVPITDPRARVFRDTSMVDAAIDWINHQPSSTPWMASVSFASAHTPVMQPPAATLSTQDAISGSTLDCQNQLQQRTVTDQMIEAMDHELARLLTSTNLARRGANGQLSYTPERTDTVVVIVGDNGSFGATVKLPFDMTRSKGTTYQTGVWVPLIVAGPVVTQPNRAVPHMVNIADLYRLFGELAGVDVPSVVPQGRQLDAVSMLPYLSEPEKPSLRSWNFTQIGPNAQANGAINAPCTIQTTCTHIPMAKEVCEDNGGVYWGPGATDPMTQGIPAAGLKRCCEVNQFLTATAAGQATPAYYSIQPLSGVAIRDAQYKLVRNFIDDYDPASDSCVAKQTDELYRIDQALPNPILDRAESELRAQGPLSAEAQHSYDTLSAQLATTLASEPACPGDGNQDARVDELDIQGYQQFAALSQGGSSWYDFNADGVTDRQDLQQIQSGLGQSCQP
jgi:arylsulfatase A-like enzyme